MGDFSFLSLDDPRTRSCLNSILGATLRAQAEEQVRRQLTGAGLLRGLSGLVAEYNNNNNLAGNNVGINNIHANIASDLSKALKRGHDQDASGDEDRDDDDDDIDEMDDENDHENENGLSHLHRHPFLTSELLLKSAAAAAAAAAVAGNAFPGLAAKATLNSLIPPVSPPCSPPSPGAGGGNGSGGASSNPNAKYSRCPICKKKLQNVRRHINEVHVGVTYTCEYCSRPFKRTDKLNNHILKEHRHLAPPPPQVTT